METWNIPNYPNVGIAIVSFSVLLDANNYKRGEGLELCSFEPGVYIIRIISPS